MKFQYKAEVNLHAIYTVNADSEDDARDKVINTELEWYVNSHSEWDRNDAGNKVKIDPIKIHKIKEVAWKRKF